MFKFACVTILCFAVSLSLAHQHGGGGIGSFFNGFNIPFFRTKASICTNTSTAPQYVVQIVNVINTLQANTTYNAILQLKFANFIVYMKNGTNQALATSNCPAFVVGVQNAKLADKVAERTRDLQLFVIQQQIYQVAQTLTGTNGPVDVNDNH